MHSKYNSKSLKFIQGLRPFSTSIPRTLKKYLKKSGYNYSNIVDNWTKMVSKKVSDYCYPVSVKMEKEMKNGTLVLNVIHGKELEIEYEKNEIIDQINSFFGYNCVNKIILKIIEVNNRKEEEKAPKLKSFSKIQNKIQKIDNDQLRSSLSDYLKSYNAKKK